MNHEDYCSYELSKKLKEKGFDWEVYRIYFQSLGEWDWYEVVLDNYNSDIGCISAPTLSQAQKWLRKEKGIAINVIAHDGDWYEIDFCYLTNSPSDIAPSNVWETDYTNYEQALSAGITKALELI